MANLVYPNSQSTLVLGGYTFQHLYEGEALNLAPVNDSTSRNNSANKGVSLTKRLDADVHDLTVVVQKHSPDDKFLNDWRNAELSVLEGSMKRAYKESGTLKKATTTLEGGSITTQPGRVDNSQDADNSSTYVIQFRSAIETF